MNKLSYILIAALIAASCKKPAIEADSVIDTSLQLGEFKNVRLNGQLWPIKRDWTINILSRAVQRCNNTLEMEITSYIIPTVGREALYFQSIPLKVGTYSLTSQSQEPCEQDPRPRPFSILTLWGSDGDAVVGSYTSRISAGNTFTILSYDPVNNYVRGYFDVTYNATRKDPDVVYPDIAHFQGGQFYIQLTK